MNMVCSIVEQHDLQKILDAPDWSSANARAREGWIGCGQERLAEAGPAGTRPGWGGRWCGLNDRTLTYEVWANIAY